MKIGSKFKKGTGAILAFVILAVVFASIAGVVYIAINGQSKTPEAAINVTPCQADLDKNGVVDSTDQNLLAERIVSHEGDGKYVAEYDLNKDTAINSLDQLLLSKNLGQTCKENEPEPIYSMSATATASSVTLTWSPGLNLISDKVYTQIYYGDMTASKIDKCESGAITGSYAGSLITSSGSIKQSPALYEGQSTYNWTSNTSNYTPVAGHKYCLYISQSNEDRTASTTVSNYVVVETQRLGFGGVPEAIDIRVPRYGFGKAFTFTNETGKIGGFQFVGYPTTHGPGINWNPATGGMQIGGSVISKIQAGGTVAVSSGRYFGTGKLKNLNNNAEAYIRVSITVYCPDLNADGTINSGDQALMAKAFNLRGENLKEDLNADGVVNSIDMSILAKNYGACK